MHESRSLGVRPIRAFAGLIASLGLASAWTIAAAAPVVIDVHGWQNDKIVDVEIINSAEVVLKSSWVQGDNNDRIEIRLPNDKPLILKKLREQPGKRVFMWFGQEADDPQSTATFAIVDGVASGTINLSDHRVFKLRFLGDDRYQIEEVDTRRLPPEQKPEPRKAPPRPAGVPPAAAPPSPQPPSPAVPQPPTPVAPPPVAPPSPAPPAMAPVAAVAVPAAAAVLAAPQLQPGQPPAEPAVDAPAQPQNGGAPPGNLLADADPMSCGDTGDTIDVLVAYSSAAKQKQGGQGAIEGQICIAESESNDTYRNSGLSHQIRIVGMQEVALNTDHIVMALDAIDDRSGDMAKLHQIREKVQADVIVLIMESPDPSCGVSHTMQLPATREFEDSAFSVVPLRCLVGKWSFAHEIGHVMGAQHDVDDEEVNNIVFNNRPNHGYVNMTPSAGKPWYTIMATTTKCKAMHREADCFRVPYWSDADNWYGNDALGKRDVSEDAKTLKVNAAIVAKFRCSQRAVPPAEHACR
jgi:hypothetical protein